MTILEFNALNDILDNLFKSHDKFYEYSDDMTYYSKGRDEKKAIINHMTNLMGYSKQNAEQYYDHMTGNK